MAKKIAEFFPMVEMVRLVSSGTEAVMGALRAARGYTGRDLVAKFEGCYHGGADYLLVKAGSGLATFGVPTSAGVPEAIGSTTRVLDYNDLEGVERYLEGEDGPKTAAIILEPVGGNMGCVPADQAFLEGLRDLCTRHGVVLVFDEVMTGFRLSKGGAQALYGVTPDLTCLGKVVGGGLPMGAYGGRREIMEKVSPVGPVYQAGTLSGNPLAVAAGLATLEILSEDPTVYDRLDEAGARLEASFTEMAAAKGKTIVVQRVGSMLTPFFHDGPVRSWKEAGACDTEAFGRWHQGMLRGGVHWPPAQYEAGFVSTAHDEEALGVTERAFEAALDAV
jgi:glutamate-1-semialdehyde 2,1-aminomutase